jgi:hypothetical protein
MAIIYNDQTGQYEWDYAGSGPMPNSQAPFDPATGLPYTGDQLPPGVNGWNSSATGAGWDTTGQYTPTGAPIPQDTKISKATPVTVKIPPTTPPATAGGGGNTGGGFQWPEFHAPRFSYDKQFSYQDFAAPTLEQAQNEPGYAFARDEGLRALTNSQAAQGVLRTGGSLKDLIGWGNRFAEQNYGNVFNRATQSYGLNRANAADAFNQNYGIARDVYDRNYNASLAEFAPKQQAAALTFSDQYNRWNAILQALLNQSNQG